MTAMSARRESLLLNPARSATASTSCVCVSATALLHRFNRNRQTRNSSQRDGRIPIGTRPRARSRGLATRSRPPTPAGSDTASGHPALHECQDPAPGLLFSKSRQMLEVGASSRYTRERERRTRLEDRAGHT